jgi:hypothetical protein
LESHGELNPLPLASLASLADQSYFQQWHNTQLDGPKRSGGDTKLLLNFDFRLTDRRSSTFKRHLNWSCRGSCAITRAWSRLTRQPIERSCWLSAGALPQMVTGRWP